MKKFYGIVLAGLLLFYYAKSAASHTPDTAGIPVLEIQDPFGYKIVVYLWVILIGLCGGISGYLRKLRNNYSRFNIAEIIGECVISCVVALLTFWLCESANIVGPLQAALIGLTSHMGSRALYQLENHLITKFFISLGNKLVEEQNVKSK